MGSEMCIRDSSTRSPDRPAPIGLSAVKLLEVNNLALVVQGIDLLDGTPVLDIKPYVAYCDAFPAARAGWVDDLAKAEQDGPGTCAASDYAGMRLNALQEARIREHAARLSSREDGDMGNSEGP